MDAYLSEIVAVIADQESDDLDAMAGRLRDAGVEVWQINRGEGVIEGLVDAQRVKQIDDMPGVEYVRTIFTYAANFPPGDPRDRDNR